MGGGSARLEELVDTMVQQAEQFGVVGVIT